MKIYILRHAVAEPRRPMLGDSKRKLTPEGLQELERVVQGLSKLKVRPDVVLSSPYQRAWDTAAVAARRLTKNGEIKKCNSLKPGGSSPEIWAEIKRHSAARALMLVGHEPLLTEFLGYLLRAPHATFKLKKAGLAMVDVANAQSQHPAAELRWLLTPSQLCAMC